VPPLVVVAVHPFAGVVVDGVVAFAGVVDEGPAVERVTGMREVLTSAMARTFRRLVFCASTCRGDWEHAALARGTPSSAPAFETSLAHVAILAG
jgi:hypothetical protein